MAPLTHSCVCACMRECVRACMNELVFAYACLGVGVGVNRGRIFKCI